MAARHLSITNKWVAKVMVFNFSVCGLKANTWQTLGETIKSNEAIQNNRKSIVASDQWRAEIWPLQKSYAPPLLRIADKKFSLRLLSFQHHHGSSSFRWSGASFAPSVVIDFPCSLLYFALVCALICFNIRCISCTFGQNRCA